MKEKDMSIKDKLRYARAMAQHRFSIWKIVRVLEEELKGGNNQDDRKNNKLRRV